MNFWAWHGEHVAWEQSHHGFSTFGKRGFMDPYGGVFRGFRQLGSVSVGTVAILPKYRRWRKWASKARKFAGFARERKLALRRLWVAVVVWVEEALFIVAGVCSSSRNPNGFFLT
ncbi:hypothetical protein Pyn_14950 [Prunus yedoensis var. nudiflora]|uniref:Uncharacterized protein n=1 Tax=Prunus yedoensis var. nudiflora TaxID=2094558 RepID=A0A314Y625_PRUYE|nr:hypothetical protein Pyn_14950 [Prunus yedoensis var. nudiflora]